MRRGVGVVHALSHGCRKERFVMRKVLLFILSLFLLTGCAVPQEAMEENEKEDAAGAVSSFIFV